MPSKPRPEWEAYVSDWMVEPARRREGLPPDEPGERVVLADGQLGASLEGGPERVNPEGSMDLSNETFVQD